MTVTVTLTQQCQWRVVEGRGAKCRCPLDTAPCTCTLLARLAAVGLGAGSAEWDLGLRKIQKYIFMYDYEEDM